MAAAQLPAPGTGTGTVEEMQFDELLSSLDDTRQMMEQQGFKMGKLHADVEHMVPIRPLGVWGTLQSIVCFKVFGVVFTTLGCFRWKTSLLWSTECTLLSVLPFT